MDGVPLAHVSSLAAAHKQVVALSFTHSDLTGVQEVLVDKAAEVRPAPMVTMETKDQVENWRIVATTKFPDKRFALDVFLQCLCTSQGGLSGLLDVLVLRCCVGHLQCVRNTIECAAF